MKRSRAITLVLLGGGVVLTLGGCGDPRREECERARRELRPDAEQICAAAASSSSSSYHRSGSSWFWGRSGGGGSSLRSVSFARSAGSAAVASSRGGFGGTASRFSSSGS